MFDSKQFREDVRQLISAALNSSGFPDMPVVYAIETTGADRYVVFVAQDLPAFDGRNQIELEVNVVAPMNKQDSAEKVADVIAEALDRNVCFSGEAAFYVYKSTRNRVDGNDPHTVRFRCTFDVYLYERTD